MKSLVFQVNVVEFLILVLAVAVQAAVDVIILDKNDYPNNSFTLDHLEWDGIMYPKIEGYTFVAVQAIITLDKNSAKITWPNIVVESYQIRPVYERAIFVIATNPNIDGRRSFIKLSNATAIQGEDIEITIAFGSLGEDETEIWNEINNSQNSQNNDDTALTPEVGEEIAQGACGEVYSVTYNDGPLVGKELVMKTCEANKPGTVVTLYMWAKIDFIEKMNRNDYRIGRHLNSFNEGINKIGPKYHKEGRIEINGKHCYYFTMEKINGKPIIEDLKGAKAARLNEDPSKFAQIFFKMLNAIIRIHKAGVLHRDMHSGNFMKLEGSEEYVIIDYGLSRVAVEWENHIKLNRPILTQMEGMYQTLRAHFDLGTDFQDEMDMFVFHIFKILINENFFGDTCDQMLLIRNKIQVLVSNWLEWPSLKKYMKFITDSIAENLNDMLFLSPTLLHCRSLHIQKLGQDEVKLSLKATDEKLFPKKADPVMEYEFNPSGYLKKNILPVVEDRYKWPDYDQYKTALFNIERKMGGQRHPSHNSTETG